MANENTGQPGSGEARITVTPSDQIISAEECSSVQRSEPCAIVIMGATGDLTARKLIPALFNLYKNILYPAVCLTARSRPKT
jgi:glucose-6-phosphate 1-dehydrogenase